MLDAQKEAVEVAELCDLSLTEFGSWVEDLEEQVERAVTHEDVARGLVEKIRNISKSGQ